MTAVPARTRFSLPPDDGDGRTCRNRFIALLSKQILEQRPEHPLPKSHPPNPTGSRHLSEKSRRKNRRRTHSLKKLMFEKIDFPGPLRRMKIPFSKCRFQSRWRRSSGPGLVEPLGADAPFSPPIAPEPAFGHLIVVAEPWAEVYVDGKSVGQTPWTRDPVVGGRRHTLKL